MAHHTSTHKGASTAPETEEIQTSDRENGFSVLMSVYHKEEPTFFRESLASVFHQTVMPHEVVLVCDGPLTQALDAVVEEFQVLYPKELKVVRLPQNGGLGKALNEGMRHCRHEIIARMDADDIAYPYRFERQINFMYLHPEIDVLNCTIDEFTEDPLKIVSRRSLPEHHEMLVHYAKRRCPVNHPSVVFRRKAIQEAGGYQHLYLFEDYYLWARMIVKGARFHSLPESLLSFRMDAQAFRRRKGWKYICSEFRLQKKFVEIGFINKGEYVRNLLLRIPPRLLPKGLLCHFYRCFLRTSA